MSSCGLETGPLHAPIRDVGRCFPAVTAHAGSLHTDANTLQSFKAALAFPVDYLEADVRFTPDHVAYLSHDALPQPLQEKTMSLEDLLKLAAPHPSVRLTLDMKEYSSVREMTGLIHRCGMASRVLLTGVTREAVPKVRDGADGLPYLLNAHPSLRQRFTASGVAGLIRTIRACGALGLNVHHRFITRRLARSLSADGLCVSVWTVDGVRRMRRMLRLGVDNVTTRRVEQMLALRGGRVP
jgi:glycerophosphoryl diester phosphodiesterase